MKRMIRLFVAVTLVLSLFGCTNITQTTSNTKDGTYISTANGYGGEMTVSVTFTEGKISDIQLGKNHETNVVIDRAFPVIKERIISANTADVDSVTAATFSSYAIKSAVSDAMEQAGLEKPTVSMENKKYEATNIEDVNVDVLVVGGGPSGLAAAITAKQVNSNLNVMVIEKLDILSGNGKFDMNFYDLINSKAQEETGNIYTIEDFIKMKANDGNGEARLKAWANSEWTMDAWLRDMGVELNYNYGGATNHMAEKEQYAGEVIQKGMEDEANRLGITIVTGTKGEDFVFDGNTVVGVKVTNNHNKSYNILAKKTIVATGGFCSNKELIAEYAPGYEVLNTSNQMGTTGDFVKVFEKYGMAMHNMDVIRLNPNIIVPRRDLTDGADMNILVNKEGGLLNDNASDFDRAMMIKEQTDGAAFYITDKTGCDSFYRVRKHVSLGYYSQGNTVEELAEALNIDPQGLKAAFEQYNSDAKAGVENSVIGAVPKRAFDAEGPYYGVRIEEGNHMTKGGVLCNEKAEVLYEDGSVVDGLYGAGEVTWQSGGYSQSVVFGRIAGESVATALSE